MTKEEQIREEQIIEAGTYHLCGSRPPKTCGHNMHELTYITRNLVFEAGAKWADEHPKPGMVNKDEFVAKVRNWLEKHTYDDKYWTPDGDDLFLGNLIGDICKYLEE